MSLRSEICAELEHILTHHDNLADRIMELVVQAVERGEFKVPCRRAHVDDMVKAWEKHQADPNRRKGMTDVARDMFPVQQMPEGAPLLFSGWPEGEEPQDGEDDH